MSPLQTRGSTLPMPPRETCDEVVAMLDETLRKPPKELGDEVDRVEQRLVSLRDVLIDRLRANQKTSDGSGMREALDQVNISLSLVAGVEYPAGGLHLKYLEMARDTIKEVRTRGALGLESLG